MKYKILILIILATTMLALTGCTKSIEEITKDDTYLNKKVSVKGTVKDPLKIGKLSGYTIVDKNDKKITIASEELAKEGTTITVKGTLKKGPLGLSYYIDVDN